MPFQEHGGKAVDTLDGHVATESGTYDKASGALVRADHAGLTAWFQYDTLPLRVTAHCTFLAVVTANPVRTGDVSPALVSLQTEAGVQVWDRVEGPCQAGGFCVKDVRRPTVVMGGEPTAACGYGATDDG